MVLEFEILGVYQRDVESERAPICDVEVGVVPSSFKPVKVMRRYQDRKGDWRNQEMAELHNVSKMRIRGTIWEGDTGPYFSSVIALPGDTRDAITKAALAELERQTSARGQDGQGKSNGKAAATAGAKG